MKLPAAIALFVDGQPLSAESVGRSNARVWRVGTQFLSQGGRKIGRDCRRSCPNEWFAGRAPVAWGDYGNEEHVQV